MSKAGGLRINGSKARRRRSPFRRHSSTRRAASGCPSKNDPTSSRRARSSKLSTYPCRSPSVTAPPANLCHAVAGQFGDDEVRTSLAGNFPRELGARHREARQHAVLRHIERFGRLLIVQPLQRDQRDQSPQFQGKPGQGARLGAHAPCVGEAAAFSFRRRYRWRCRRMADESGFCRAKAVTRR